MIRTGTADAFARAALHLTPLLPRSAELAHARIRLSRTTRRAERRHVRVKATVERARERTAWRGQCLAQPILRRLSPCGDATGWEAVRVTAPRQRRETSDCGTMGSKPAGFAVEPQKLEERTSSCCSLRSTVRDAAATNVSSASSLAPSGSSGSGRSSHGSKNRRCAAEEGVRGASARAGLPLRVNPSECPP